MFIKADFHIHSCVSPCGDLRMSPGAIVASAKKSGLSVCALTDHNTSVHCVLFQELCLENELTPLFGIEITMPEEYHMLCITEDVALISEVSQFVYEALPEMKNVPEKFGDQVIVNRKEEIIGVVDKYLGNATNSITVSDIRAIVGKDALLIPSHIDRARNSVISQLGFVPEEDFDAVEIYRTEKIPEDMDVRGFPFVSNSDSHYLKDVGIIQNVGEIEDEGTLIKNIRKSLIRGMIRPIFR